MLCGVQFRSVLLHQAEGCGGEVEILRRHACCLPSVVLLPMLPLTRKVEHLKHWRIMVN